MPGSHQAGGLGPERQGKVGTGQRCARQVVEGPSAAGAAQLATAVLAAGVDRAVSVPAAGAAKARLPAEGLEAGHQHGF